MQIDQKPIDGNVLDKIERAKALFVERQRDIDRVVQIAAGMAVHAGYHHVPDGLATDAIKVLRAIEAALEKEPPR
jgi:hypothetical protein